MEFRKKTLCLCVSVVINNFEKMKHRETEQKLPYKALRQNSRGKWLSDTLI
jgi:hypothetical protein